MSLCVYANDGYDGWLSMYFQLLLCMCANGEWVWIVVLNAIISIWELHSYICSVRLGISMGGLMSMCF